MEALRAAAMRKVIKSRMMREKWVVRKTIHDHYSDSNQLTYIYMTSCMTMTLDLLPWAIAMGDLGGKYNHKAET